MIDCKTVAYQSMFFFPAGRGGASIFGKQFEDELHPELKFTGNTVQEETDVNANVDCLLIVLIRGNLLVRQCFLFLLKGKQKPARTRIRLE